MTVEKITSEVSLKKAFDIRKSVFVEEQGVPLEDEFDQFDQLTAPCQHILVYTDNEPVGTGRVRAVDGIGKLERICILEPFRKLGLGKVIIHSLEEIAKDMSLSKVKLHGQTHAEEFYAKLGYHTASEVFMEDGIPHFLMTKELI